MIPGKGQHTGIQCKPCLPHNHHPLDIRIRGILPHLSDLRLGPAGIGKLAIHLSAPNTQHLVHTDSARRPIVAVLHIRCTHLQRIQDCSSIALGRQRCSNRHSCRKVLVGTVPSSRLARYSFGTDFQCFPPDSSRPDCATNHTRLRNRMGSVRMGSSAQYIHGSCSGSRCIH